MFHIERHDENDSDEMMESLKHTGSWEDFKHVQAKRKSTFIISFLHFCPSVLSSPSTDTHAGTAVPGTVRSLVSQIQTLAESQCEAGRVDPWDFCVASRALQLSAAWQGKQYIRGDDLPSSSLFLLLTFGRRVCSQWSRGPSCIGYWTVGGSQGSWRKPTHVWGKHAHTHSWDSNRLQC